MAKKIIVVISLFLLSSVSFLFPQELKRISELPEVKIGKIEYICLNDAVKMLGGQIYQEKEEDKVVWYYKGKRLEFTLLSPYLLIDEAFYDLLFEVRLKNGKILVPKKNFISLLYEIEKQSKGTEKEFLTQSSYLEYNITDITASKKLNGVLIEVFVSRALEYDVFTSENNCTNIFFYQGRVDTSYFNYKTMPKVVKKIRAYQYANSAQVSIWMKKPFHTFSHNLESFPFRVQISLVDTTRISSLPQAKNSQRDLIDVVAIDPGHGGIDFGFFGSGGIKEKDVTLAIALRLKELLEKETDLKVVLTRENDYSLPLEKRAREANKRGGDLLISLHCGFSVDETESGFEIVCFGNTQKEMTESTSVQDSNLVDSSLVLEDEQYHFSEQSESFASFVSEALEENPQIRSKGIYKKRLLILKKAYMPGISIRCGYLSNPEEEKLLAEGFFREKIAKALFLGIVRFKIESEQKKDRDI